MSEDPTPGGPPPGGERPPRSGFTLDLSSPGGSARSKRPKGFVPVVQQTINLTTKRTETPAEAPAPADPTAGRPGQNPADARGRPDRRDDSRPEGRRSGGGTSLADLLDEATLARLRGGA